MILYKLITRGLGEFYLIANNATEAQNKLEGELRKANYGFHNDQDVINIEIITDELKEFPEGKLNFSSKSKLIICK